MTREEAKAWFKVLLKDEYAFNSADREAFAMAIKALEQEPYEDVIDRAEAMTEIMMFAGNVKSDEEDIYIKVSDAVQLLRELSPVNPQPKWIPVSEKLPEDEQEILFSTKTGRVHSGKYHDDGSVNQWYSHKDKCRAWNNVVNAWMPLPDPYKPQERKEQE